MTISPKQSFLCLLLVILTTACAGSESADRGTAQVDPEEKTGDGAAPGSTAPRGALPAGAAPRIAGLDGCALLDPQEVESILGNTPQGHPEEMTGFDITCTWTLEAGDGGSRSLTLEVGQLDTFIEDEYASFEENMDHQEDVSGIGDAAFLASTAYGGAAIVSRDGDLLLILTSDLPDREAALRDLAPKVLRRIDERR